jgi:hypothetical protein
VITHDDITDGIFVIPPTRSLVIERGSAVPFPVTLHNNGHDILPEQSSVVLRWRTREGDLLEEPTKRYPLEQPLAPVSAASSACHRLAGESYGRA